MKKLLLLSILLSGCAQYCGVPPAPVFVNVPGYDTQALQQSLARSQILASQYNSFLQGVVGPNNVSAELLRYQNVNRNLEALIANPWNALPSVQNYVKRNF